MTLVTNPWVFAKTAGQLLMTNWPGVDMIGAAKAALERSFGANMESADYHEIYHTRAEHYEALVAREDREGNILAALREICPLHGRHVFDLGAGTGRLTRLLAPHVRAIYGFDNSLAMLAVARRLLRDGRWHNWGLAAADHRALPCSDQTADLLISGWSLCYLALDQGDGWQSGLRQLFAQYQRLLRPGGVFIILETMGTGYRRPQPPSFMLDYFAFLQEMGFQSRWIRTDYEFESLEEAVYLTRFFFGDQLADRVEAEQLRIVPECTGIWWK